ncbi:MAG: hypothetical protein R8G66_26865 [Cytophagales bacterium]|nr:hypothetical protein [Cytophagales bacterium]
MGNSFIVFEQASGWIALGVVIALVLAIVPYFRVSYPWSKSMSVFLGTLRFLGIFLLFLLLLNPLLRQLKNRTEEPIVAVLYDHSESVKMMTDSVTLQGLRTDLEALGTSLQGQNINVDFWNLNQQLASAAELQSSVASTSNLSGALNELTETYQGINLAAVVMVSDGIYNRGVSPTYYQFSKPVFSLGLGDTIPVKDISIKSIKSNTVAYQGNQFPVEVIVEQEGFENQEKTITIRKNGKALQTKNFTNEARLDFLLDADQAGLARYSVAVTPLEEETSIANNSSDFYVDVIEGKERILILTAAPHPDIAAIRRALDQSENFETELFIPGLSKQEPSGEYDVIIEHGAFSRNFPKIIIEGNPSRWYILNKSSQLDVAQEATGWSIEAQRAQRDNVRAAFNPVFSSFELDQDEIDIFSRFTPISVPFGEYSAIGPVQTLIYQQIGSVITSRPLLAVQNDGANKSAVLMGPGIWQWRMLENTENGTSEHFDEIINKLIQFLSVKADKRKFRYQPTRSSFDENVNVQFQAELYNDIYERVYGQKIDISLIDESGNSQPFEYYPSEEDGGLNIGPLPVGVYRFEARSSFNGKNYSARGEFSVKQINLESIELTADHQLLQEISKNTGGNYYHVNQKEELFSQLRSLDPPGIIRTSENFFPLIESIWLLVFAVLFFTTEWMLRKFLGSY